MAEYNINKGIGQSVEFKGLKAQYLFIFAGGLLAVFVLFVVSISLASTSGCASVRVSCLPPSWSGRPSPSTDATGSTG